MTTAPAKMMREVSQETAAKHNLTEHEMWAKVKFAERVAARNECYYECRKQGHGVWKIAHFFKVHHTSVMHGASKHAHIYGLEPVTEYDYEKVTRVKRERARGASNDA